MTERERSMLDVADSENGGVKKDLPPQGSSSTNPENLPFAPYDPTTDKDELEKEVLPGINVPFIPAPDETVQLVPSKVPEVGQN